MSEGAVLCLRPEKGIWSLDQATTSEVANHLSCFKPTSYRVTLPHFDAKILIAS